ncbi:MAG TPA: hypothetical protein PLB05_10715 [Candidatus Omnitrophota bacterium]|nr:hypothetical protein [Candidatus Omnitrophota bacterium]
MTHFTLNIKNNYLPIEDFHFFSYTKAMKGFIFALVGLAWMLALYFGWMFFVGRTYSGNPEIDSSETLKQKQYTTRQAEEIKKKQRLLLQEREQRMKDLQRR